jgi:hypothetical protein
VGRTAGTLAALCLAILVAGCGGGSSGESSAAQPTLNRGIAEELAKKAEEIADKYEAGSRDDVCQAAQLADELKDRVDAGVADGKIPAAFQDELVSTATQLQNEINCAPAEPPPPKEDKGKKKGHHDDGETTLGTTTEIGTTTGEGD